jgi:hypothetical protein
MAMTDDKQMGKGKKKNDITPFSAHEEKLMK